MQAAVYTELEELCSLARLEPRHSSELIEKMRQLGFGITQSFLKKIDEFAGATHYLFLQRNGTYRLTISNEETSRFERLVKKYHNSLENAAHNSASKLGLIFGPLVGVGMYVRINESYFDIPIDDNLGILMAWGLGAVIGCVMGKDVNKMRVDSSVKNLERHYGHRVDGTGKQYDFLVIKGALK